MKFHYSLFANFTVIQTSCTALLPADLFLFLPAVVPSTCVSSSLSDLESVVRIGLIIHPQASICNAQVVHPQASICNAQVVLKCPCHTHMAFRSERVDLKNCLCMFYNKAVPSNSLPCWS